jgi:ATP-dependent RNA helicase MSS116, mitochondrial
VGKNVIMASSDVSARGMDYPDVTFVLQVGMTDRDQYIHRLGRTARAGKGGNGLLLLAPFEFDYMTRKELADLPLQSVAAEEKLPQQPSALVRFLDV